ncbi:unnamed protein product [Orchesella dallaii]|uniref:Uncharacterized protein n=1 Tax=Orchesella dallaii TaxID=48710 RepID=A0ABP1RA80_9HEXA
MEVYEIEDNLIPINNGQNYFLQQVPSFAPTTQYISDFGGGIEFMDEGTTHCADGSLLQVIDPNPAVIVNYVYGSDGSLIPVYERLPVENTVTILTSEPEPPPEEPSIPPHVLDHMYARKPKEPGSEAQPRPRKRVKKKETVVQEYTIPEITPNTTKINIIRKGLPSATLATFRPAISRPKILQAKSTAPSSSLSPAPQKTIGVNLQVTSSTPSPTTLAQPQPELAPEVSMLSTSTSLTSASENPTNSTINYSSSPPTPPPLLSNNLDRIENEDVVQQVSNPDERTNMFVSTLANDDTQQSFSVPVNTSDDCEAPAPTETDGTVNCESEVGDDMSNSICIMLPPTSSSSSTNLGGGETELTIQLSESAIAAIARSKDEAVITFTTDADTLFSDDFGMEDGDGTDVGSDSTTLHLRNSTNIFPFSYA